MTAPPISDEARALLDEFASAQPGPARADANWEGLQRRLDGSPRLSLVDDDDVETGLDDEPHGAPRPSSSPWSRWAVSAALSVAIAAAVLLALRVVVGAGRRAQAQAVGVGTQAADAAQGKADAPATERTPTKATSRTPVPNDPTTTDSVPAVPETTPVPTPKTAVTATSASREPVPASASQLAEETKLLVGARKALADDRFGDAVDITARHRTEFPEGALREEMRAIEAIASCRDGKGMTAAHTFVKAYPSSPHAPRVRAACPTR